MKKCYVLLFFITALFSKARILHISFHTGCINEIEQMGRELGLDITSLYVQSMPSKWIDGKTAGNGIYNITHQLAHDAWKLHKDFFNQFDGVITSDTAPLSRIFLQNGWDKPLIIYVCNRFDYADMGTSQGKFPDKKYYELFQQAVKNPLVKIVSYTPFEHFYARRKGIDIGTLTIKPSTMPEEKEFISSIPSEIDKGSTFFLPPYQNETVFMNFSQKCTELGIKNFCGRYNGPQDLKEFKGIIHIPYALSNLALFENIQLGLIYFVPSRNFIERLSHQGNFWFQDRGLGSIDHSEWYLPENAPLFVYFDSWQDLKNKIDTLDYEKKREEVLTFAHRHRKTMLNRWKKVFKKLQLL